jgi:hypothetical protein
MTDFSFLEKARRRLLIFHACSLIWYFFGLEPFKIYWRFGVERGWINSYSAILPQWPTMVHISVLFLFWVIGSILVFKFRKLLGHERPIIFSFTYFLGSLFVIPSLIFIFILFWESSRKIQKATLVQ